MGSERRKNWRHNQINRYTLAKPPSCPKKWDHFNNDWTDAGLLDQLIDWMLQRFGHLPQVMQAFLLHVERSFENRTSEFLASRLGDIASVIWQSRGFWSGGRSAQLAGLLQSFAERDTPLKHDVHMQFLEILDNLIELGDRRAAALQSSSLFDLPRRRTPQIISSIGSASGLPRLIPE